MPPLPPAPGPARKRKSSGTSSTSKSKTRSKPRAEEVPVIGWLMGLGIGGVFSLIAILWLSWATLNSRAQLAMLRDEHAAKQAKDWTRLYQIYAAERDRKFTLRLWERGEPLVREFVCSRSCYLAAIECGDTPLIAQEAERALEVLEILEQKHRNDPTRQIRSHYLGDGCRWIRPAHQWKRRLWLPAILHAGQFEQAIDYLRTELAEFDACHERTLLAPAPANLTSDASLYLPQYRDARQQLIWACTCAGQYAEALAEIDKLLQEPKASWSRDEQWSWADPELTYLKAAIFLKLGRRDEAQSSYAEAQRLLVAPPPWTAIPPNLTPSQRAAYLQQFPPSEPVKRVFSNGTALGQTDIVQSWQLYRDNQFGLAYEFSGETTEFGVRIYRRWSSPRVPEDPTAALVQEFGPPTSATPATSTDVPQTVVP